MYFPQIFLGRVLKYNASVTPALTILLMIRYENYHKEFSSNCQWAELSSYLLVKIIIRLKVPLKM